MRCKLIKDLDGANPDWDPRDPESPHTIPVPAGTVLEGHDAWMHVCLGRAIPADEECWNRVAKRNPQLVDKILKKFPDARKPADVEQPGEPPAKTARKPKGDAPPAA